MMTPDRRGKHTMILLTCHRPARAAKSLLLALLVMLSLLITASAQAEALAQVNRTTVAEGSTLTLRVRTRDLDHSLDITPLLRDFEVVSQTQSTNNPALTGLGTEFQEWEIMLTPRSSGQITIPALLVGEQLTQPISIRVIAVSPEQRAVMDREVFLEVDIANESPYVGEPVLVRLSLYYNVNVNGTFADVNPEESEWTALGDGHTGTVERGGKTYNYTRFHYLYTPLTAGERALPAFEFEGDYRAHNLAPRQRLTDVRSDPIELAVRPVPDEFPGGYSWLPARDLTLSQSWSDDREEFSAGDQLSRQLALSALGPAAANLPSVLNNLQQPDGVNTYPGSARTQDVMRTDDRLATREEQQDILLTTAGEQILPEVRVPWWDLDSDRLRWAEVPGRALQVAGVMPSSVLPESTSMPTAADSDTTSTASASMSWLNWLLAGLFGAGLAIAGLLLWRRKHEKSRQNPRAGSANSSHAPRLPGNALRQAARRHLYKSGHWLWFLVTLPARLVWRLIKWVTRPLTGRLQSLLERTGLRRPQWLHWFTVRQAGNLWHAWRAWRAERQDKGVTTGGDEPGGCPAGPETLEKSQAEVRQKAQTGVFVAEARSMIEQWNWAGLMQLLAHHLSDQGWPDTNKVERKFGVTGLTDLVRRSQRQQYGRKEDREPNQKLAQEWQALLANWPESKISESDRKNAPGLYPD